MEGKIKLGISRCLLGEKVRYDGGHKLDRFLRDELGRLVEWVLFCPEVECGLSTPREAMDLTGIISNPQLTTVSSKINHTAQMSLWIENKLLRLGKIDLSGVVFKTKSPSCALSDAKFLNEDGEHGKKAAGLFARAFIKKFPNIPVIDEVDIHNPILKSNFITRVYIYSNFKEALKLNSKNWLLNFHRKHKLIIMSHAPSKTAVLGRLSADAKKYSPKLYEEYLSILMEALKQIASIGKNVNVLHHIFGYFKNDLALWEKQELLKAIDDYSNGLIPVIVPVTLLRHYIEKYKKKYLKDQYYLYMNPLEFELINPRR